MIYTNKHGLPAYLFEILSHDWYGGTGVKHDFSVTQIGNPINMTLLESRHRNELEADVMDAYVQALGIGFHLMCETAMIGYYERKGIKFVNGNGIEERKFITIDGVTISGQVDLYIPDEQKLVDYKVTKTSSYIFKGREEKYLSQMNINSYIFRKNGFPVKHLEIAELYRDFEEKLAKFDPKYPKIPINILNIAQLTDAIIEYRIKGYINEYKKFKDVPDSELPVCSPEERWERGGGWAVMKNGMKRAVKLCDTEQEAIAYRSLNCSVSNTYIEERNVTPLRCVDWCSANKFCRFYQDYMKKQGKVDSDEENNSTGNQDNRPNSIF